MLGIGVELCRQTDNVEVVSSLLSSLVGNDICTWVVGGALEQDDSMEQPPAVSTTGVTGHSFEVWKIFNSSKWV